MATAGLSLVGFMDQLQAINHLRTACIPTDPSDAALTAIWSTAKGNIGNPIPNCGNPDIQPIPPANQPHIQQLLLSPWAQSVFQGPWVNATFQMVEIDPLLAYQFTIDSVRSNHHCSGLSNPPTVSELLPICLPLNPIPENFESWGTPQSAIIKSKGLNLVPIGSGIFNAAFMGMSFGPALPFTHVVRHNGRCYLHNGFHRALGARLAGATHIPCVFRDVPDHASVGIKTDGATFSSTLLESNNPPTLAHFTQGRACNVMIRSVSRVLHVSWADYVIPNE